MEPPLKTSPNYKLSCLFKRGGNIPTQISSQILKPLFCKLFWEALQFEATLLQLRTFHMDLHPQHMSN